ncbi:trehalase-like [Hyalella azteca]|uniref:Trehalase n=1 Tax=Hyalella azteca TaxID=294128 RepID=A0A979FPF9_HYAAZ|nr:trehalase-like [Hyalella azteca]
MAVKFHIKIKTNENVSSKAISWHDLANAKDKKYQSRANSRSHSTGCLYRPVTLLAAVLLCCSYAAQTGAQSASGLPYPCDSNIYCYGDLLKTVQLARIYSDSKHFVDMPLVDEPEIVQTNFAKLMDDTAGNPSKEQVQEFVEANFNEPGAEFENWSPDDWTESPAFLANISDAQYYKFATNLVALWKDLGRKISPTVAENPEKFSQIYVEKPVVVPGGRFREFYYWDSYWTIDGLLLSEMTTTVKGMLENFLHMVAQFGMVPNGGRVYYTRRSQPPYLIPMIKEYVDYTNDTQFVRDNIGLMEKEFNFWFNNRTTEIKLNGSLNSYKVALYNSQVDEPRPESYREDYEMAQQLPEQQRTQLYVEFKSGAESGWDYSSRWYNSNGTNRGTLKNLQVTSIAPVDLNSLLCYNAKILAGYHKLLGNLAKAVHYENIHENIVRTIEEVFWDEEDGIWYDFDIKAMKRRRFFYLSNVHPLWSGSYNASNAATVTARVISYLKSQKVLDYIGMKYNVNLVGAPGGGGEYDVQLGFGWTNGVALRFLNDFGDRLTSPPDDGVDTSGAPAVDTRSSWGIAVLVSTFINARLFR